MNVSDGLKSCLNVEIKSVTTFTKLYNVNVPYPFLSTLVFVKRTFNMAHECKTALTWMMCTVNAMFILFF